MTSTQFYINNIKRKVCLDSKLQFTTVTCHMPVHHNDPAKCHMTVHKLSRQHTIRWNTTNTHTLCGAARAGPVLGAPEPIGAGAHNRQCYPYAWGLPLPVLPSIAIPAMPGGAVSPCPEHVPNSWCPTRDLRIGPNENIEVLASARQLVPRLPLRPTPRCER